MRAEAAAGETDEAAFGLREFEGGTPEDAGIVSGGFNSGGGYGTGAGEGIAEGERCTHVRGIAEGEGISEGVGSFTAY